MDGQFNLKLTKAEIDSAFQSPIWAERFPPILSTEQAAEMLQVPKRTIYDWSSRGLLKGCARKPCVFYFAPARSCFFLRSIPCPLSRFVTQRSACVSSRALCMYNLLGASQDSASKLTKDFDLLDYVHERGGRVTARELCQGVRRYRGNKTLAEAELQQLVECKAGTWQQCGKATAFVLAA